METELSSTPIASGPYVLAFDVGGSHISAGFCALQSLQVVSVTSGPLPVHPSRDEFVELLYSLGMQAANGKLDHCLGASLAMPGPFDYASGISYMEHKLEALYAYDLRAGLAARFGWNPARIRFLNDAGAFLLGEVAAGAARGYTRAVGIALGTGIGSAFAANGQLLTEGEGVPPGGEIWNYPYGRGTVEDVLSTRALKARYLELAGREDEVVAIAQAAATDPVARQVFEEFGRTLGEVLGRILADFRPDVIVLGGGISRSSHLFLPAAQPALTALHCNLCISSLLDRAAVIGAAAYWRNIGADRTIQLI